MADTAFANTAAQSKSGNPAMFACTMASVVSSTLILRALSLSLSVLLFAMLCGILISLVLLRGSGADGIQS